jgi:sugar diacid utilization regulator
MSIDTRLLWTPVVQRLEAAAFTTAQRDEYLAGSLQEMLALIPAVSAALVWPCPQKPIPWKVLYAGIRRSEMLRWLNARLDASLEMTMSILQHDLACLSDMPEAVVLPLRPPGLVQHGLLVLWLATSAVAIFTSPSPAGPVLNTDIQQVCTTLEAILEVESKEALFFPGDASPLDRQITEALAHGDTNALSAALSLTKMLGKADLVYWGQVRQNHVEVEWHVGARQTGFGFELPLGHGIGGRVALNGTYQNVLDYRNSPHRYPGVREIVDREQVRCGVVIPVHDSSMETRAVLYVVRRTLSPLSQADRLLVQRLAHSLEPLVREQHAPSNFLTAVPSRLDKKAAWRDLVLHAQHVEAIEGWLVQVINGSAILTDEADHPYVLSHSDRLQQWQATPQDKDVPLVLPLALESGHKPGKLYLCPGVALPPADWPDFFADVSMLCNLVIQRAEQTQHHLAHKREQWLHRLLEEKSSRSTEQEGYRLGLPIEQGQAWVIAWEAETVPALKSPRMRMVAEDVMLDTIKSPLILLDDLGVVLLREALPQPSPPRFTPSEVRDELLKHLGPYPLWIIHGAVYHSLAELRTTLPQAIKMARQARREKREQYVSDIYAFGLDSLLENPRLSDDLETFARHLLAPLLEYDTHNKANLTETFVLMQTLGSLPAVAEHLAVHVNTIRYRLRRAEEILGKDCTSPRMHAALMLAAFIWRRTHNHHL